MTPAAVYSLYLILAAGAVAIYFLMPRMDPPRVGAGIVFGSCALLGLILFFAFRTRGSGGPAYFYICSAIALVAAVRVITHAKPVYSAIYFVLLVVAMAALLVSLAAEFLAAALVIVYAGAILVTYLFVIMLAQQSEPAAYDRSVREPILAILACFVLAGAVAAHAADPTYISGESAWALASQSDSSNIAGSTTGGNTLAIGALLMTKYVVVLELSGLLLLISMVGAIALSRKKVPVAPYLGAHQRIGLYGKEAEPF